MVKVRQIDILKTSNIKEFVCPSLSSINDTRAQRYWEQVFLNKRHKRGQQIRIGTADKVMIPVAFCFWAIEEDLRLEHIPWLT